MLSLSLAIRSSLILPFCIIQNSCNLCLSIFEPHSATFSIKLKMSISGNSPHSFNNNLGMNKVPGLVFCAVNGNEIQWVTLSETKTISVHMT